VGLAVLGARTLKGNYITLNLVPSQRGDFVSTGAGQDEELGDGAKRAILGAAPHPG
jgi:hypothetical protein